MKPIVHGLQEDYGSDIEFVYIDIDSPDSQEAKATYGFRYQPHFLLVDENGEIVQQWLGYNSANVFETAFSEILSN